MSPEARTPRSSPTLPEIARDVRAHLLRRVGLALTLWWGAALGAAMVAAWILTGPEGWRQGSRGPLILDVVVALLGLGSVGLLRLVARRWLDEAHLSRAMEEAAGLMAGVVRGSLELSRGIPHGVSGALAARAAQGTADRLDGSPESLGGELARRISRWVRRGLAASGGVAVILVLLAVAAPPRAGGAWWGLATPLQVAVPPVLEAVDVSPGDVEVPRGADVEMRVTARGLEQVELAWQTAGEVARTETLALHDGTAVKRFARVTAATEYRVRTADGRTTRRFRITPVDPLFVSGLKVEVIYPRNTGLPPDEFHGTVPPLRLPEGSRLDISGRTSRPLSSAALVDGSGRAVLNLHVDGSGFSASWTPRRTGRFPWSFRDRRGAPAAVQPDPLEVGVLVADSAPEVAIPLPGVDTVMPLGARQPLIVEARDDYGLRRLEVVAWRVTVAGEVGSPDTMGIDLVGTRAAMARPLLDMSDWGLLPGDHVRYYARAVDNAPQPHSARSREYVLRVPDPSEIRHRAKERLDSMAAALRQVADQAGKQAAENRNREMQGAAAEAREQAAAQGARGTRGTAASDQADFKQREEVRKALAEQKALEARLDSTKAELDDLARSMENAGQGDPRLTKELAELRQLMDQVAKGGDADQLKALSKDLEKRPGESSSDADQTLKALAARQEKLRQRLEASLERFRRAAAQQEFRATASDAKDLARQEHVLADALKDPHDPLSLEARARQQAALAERAAKLGARMDSLKGRLDRLKDPQASGDVGEARKHSENARRSMARAGSARGRQQAAQEARNAAASMDEVAKRLDDAQQRMVRRSEERTRDALLRAADDALALARRQSRLRDRMEGAPQDTVLSMRGDEEALVEGVANLARNVAEGARGAVAGNAAVSDQVSRVQASLRGTIDAMSRQRTATPVPLRTADQVVGDLNRLALVAMASAQQPGRQADQEGKRSGQQGQQGQQGATGQKGQKGQQEQGSRDTQQEVQRLAQKEGDLVNKTAELTPMQLGAQALKEQLRQLAEEQQTLAEQLSEAAKKPDAGERTLGDLSSLAEEARELARQMAQGRLTPDMMKRQGKLFHRLLDAGRSLDSKDDFSDEREATAAKSHKPMVVAPLEADQLGALRYGRPDAEELQKLPPAVRRLVVEYFDRLNGRSGGGGR